MNKENIDRRQVLIDGLRFLKTSSLFPVASTIDPIPGTNALNQPQVNNTFEIHENYSSATNINSLGFHDEELVRLTQNSQRKTLQESLFDSSNENTDTRDKWIAGVILFAGISIATAIYKIRSRSEKHDKFYQETKDRFGNYNPSLGDQILQKRMKLLQNRKKNNVKK